MKNIVALFLISLFLYSTYPKYIHQEKIYNYNKNYDFLSKKNTEYKEDDLNDSLLFLNQYLSVDSSYILSLYQITDSILFNELYVKYYEKELEPYRIENIDSVKNRLKKQIDIEKDEYNVAFVKRIEALNGRVKVFDHKYEEGLFVAYYPEYNFILMEGGHTIDLGNDLITGESIEEAGNPADQTLSPNRRYRISGVYGGQECSSYIVQEYKANRYQKIAEINDEKLCYMKSHFWLNDTVFYYSEKNYLKDHEEGILGFYKLVIRKNKFSGIE